MSYINFERRIFGRADSLGLLNRRVVGLKEGFRQNVALLGSQYVGKSSVLCRLIQKLPVIRFLDGVRDSARH